MTEAPRFSTFLRVTVDGESPFDRDAALLARAAALSRLASSSHAEPTSAPPGLPRGARNALLASLNAALGGGVASEELAAAADGALDALRSSRPGAEAATLADLFGLAADAAAGVVAAAAPLRAARPAPRAPAHAPRAEWGAELGVCPPRPLRRAASAPLSCSSSPHGPAPPVEAAPLAWLRSHVSCLSTAGALGGAFEDVASAVLGVLLSASPPDAAASALFGLAGDAGAASVAALMQHRGEVCAAARHRLSALREAMGDVPHVPHAPPGRPAPGTGVVTFGPTPGEKAARKEGRREAKRAAAAGDDPLLVWFSTSGLPFDVLLSGPEAAWRASGTTDDGMPYGAGGGAVTRDALRTALPPGSTRATRPGYETVTVPPPSAAPLRPGEGGLTPLTSLSPWERLAFGGMTHLNRIQTAIEPAARRAAHNLLVCAPTGAGKTNIAMLAVLRELRTRIVGSDPSGEADADSGDDGRRGAGGEAARGGGGGGGGTARVPVFDTRAFKVVYVAPMKALAAEVAAAFGRRLAPLGVTVRELTGDTQLSRAELEATHMLVTTPEKWDVVTRKGGAEGSAAAAAALLILDEVHLLAEERGAVLEALVARTRRQVEAQQKPIRILALSATLPNPADVAEFLGVPLPSGLFVFDASFRPVPLTQRFVGVSEPNPQKRVALMTRLAFEEAAAAARRGQQAMVFVHSRADTGRTARAIADLAAASGDGPLFATLDEADEGGTLRLEVGRSKSRELAELVPKGFALHHAGMLRPDRSLAERLFSRGAVRVLVCTATLAWGVNLPAHTVIIKGTQVYDAARGGFKDLGVLDVAQIFGRAGRPQFDTSGEGVIITPHASLAHYLRMLTAAVPIESQFLASLRDNLNAEVVLGSVSDVSEGAAWLAHSFFAVRARRNPTAYGLTRAQLAADTGLSAHRAAVVREAARSLDAARMVRFDERSGQIYTTDAGRVAAHFYLRATSMEAYHELLKPSMSLPDMFALVARSAEFENIAPREEEMPELEELASSPSCPVDVRGSLSSKEGKANVLIQAYISRARLESFSLIADSAYVAASVVRICRALAELTLRRGWPAACASMLTLAKCADRRLWPQQHPLRQFEPAAGWDRSSHGRGAASGGGANAIPLDALRRLEEAGPAGGLHALVDMGPAEIAALARTSPAIGGRIASAVAAFPWVELSASAAPLTRTVLRCSVVITPCFEWRDAAHGSSLRWLLWVEDTHGDAIYHSETITLTKRAWASGQPLRASFTLPLHEPLPPQHWVRVASESWLASEATAELPLRHLRLPTTSASHTELLPLRPLPLSALCDVRYEALYAGKFTHFNAVQTQAFHALYRTDASVLLGAPTGSGKTVSAELAVLRAFAAHPSRLVVYIAPLKALVRERVDDWTRGMCAKLGKRLVELTGDARSDAGALERAHIVVATPEKWDAVSRGWGSRSFVRRVCCLIVDEIHLLGADRGPVLEVLVSRMRFVAASQGHRLRVVGLSTALANAGDVGAWMGVDPAIGLFNFRPAVRPVPLEVHIQGHAGDAYCPRMAAMNKPCYAAIKAHAPGGAPALVFVASRRQTRLTAAELIALASADDSAAAPVFLGGDPRSWAGRAKDPSLAHSLEHGVGMHHAGLGPQDRSLVESLFLSGAIRVLVATSTLAWGVNLPAHLVVIKGTEFYDGASRRYVDFPITDVLQMMGRAGRPQFDTSGVAVILVHEPKKAFYKKFLYEPFPVESGLAACIDDHVNAEVAALTVRSAADALDWLTWTYLFSRVQTNPAFYGVGCEQEETGAEGGEAGAAAAHGGGGGRAEPPQPSEAASIDAYLSRLVADSLAALQASGCVALSEEAGAAFSAQRATPNGAIPNDGPLPSAAPAPPRSLALPPPPPPLLRDAQAPTGWAAGPDAAAPPPSAAAAAPPPPPPPRGALSAGARPFRGRAPPPSLALLRVDPTPLGRVAAQYYLRHQTAGLLRDTLAPLASSQPPPASHATRKAVALSSPSPRAVLAFISRAEEYVLLPVRHGEDVPHAALCAAVKAAGGWPPSDCGPPDSPSSKAGLLLQAHMLRLPPPTPDFGTDARAVLDNASRLINATIDAAAALCAPRTSGAWVLAAISLLQGVAEGAHPGVARAAGAAPRALHTSIESAELRPAPRSNGGGDGNIDGVDVVVRLRARGGGRPGGGGTAPPQPSFFLLALGGGGASAPLLALRRVRSAAAAGMTLRNARRPGALTLRLLPESAAGADAEYCVIADEAQAANAEEAPVEQRPQPPPPPRDAPAPAAAAAGNGGAARARKLPPPLPRTMQRGGMAPHPPVNGVEGGCAQLDA